MRWRTRSTNWRRSQATTVGKILTELADLITLSQQAGDAAVVMSAGFGQMGEALGRISQGVGSLGQNLGNLVAGAAQVADGAVTAFGVMEKATDKASKGMRVAGGALAGAKIGAQFGGAWGAAAGAAMAPSWASSASRGLPM